MANAGYSTKLRASPPAIGTWTAMSNTNDQASRWQIEMSPSRPGHMYIKTAGTQASQDLYLAAQQYNGINYGTFHVTNHAITNFAGWADDNGVKVVAGDFNGDGKTDLALCGGHGWNTMPTAMSKSRGRFSVTNHAITHFASWAQTSPVQMVAGDVNGDGKDDVILAGGAGWGSIPVAMSKGNGQYDVSNDAVTSFPGWADDSGVKLVAGDINGDGFSDLALCGVNGWGSMPTAFTPTMKSG